MTVPRFAEEASNVPSQVKVQTMDSATGMEVRDAFSNNDLFRQEVGPLSDY